MTGFAAGPGMQGRVQALNQRAAGEGPYLVYWMQSSQRASCNHALEYAIHQAKALDKPLIVYFGLTDAYPEANLRHYRFMLEGLAEVEAALARRGIRFLILHTSPEEGALALSALSALMVVDRGYLKIERAWRETVAAAAACPLIQVESNVIVPVEIASPKEEYAAATFRPKIRRALSGFLVPLHEEQVSRPSLQAPLPFQHFPIDDIDRALLRLNLDGSVQPSGHFQGGTSRAERLLETFIADKLPQYGGLKNDPGLDASSQLSPYLHFGQISPFQILERLAAVPEAAKEAFLEELVVRRELAVNFVRYAPHYDHFEAVPAWAKASLTKHLADPRPYHYGLSDLENARTHDPYWNAAQREMAITGKMNGYMRMYWGKKILEWCPAPEEAYAAALHLNNKYNLDGRDPNGFAGVAWCFGKHDRPWQERPIFGMVRYMNAAGLERKFDMAGYLGKVARL